MEQIKTENKIKKDEHTLCLDKRESLKISGVIKVYEFSQTQIVLSSVMGKITIKGEGLHIEKLNVDTQEFESSGNVNSLVYSKDSHSKKSILERMFK